MNQILDSDLIDEIMGNDYRVCGNCKYFKCSPHNIVAPMRPLTADGFCEMWKDQPVVLDSKTDTCVKFLLGENFARVEPPYLTELRQFRENIDNIKPKT